MPVVGGWHIAIGMHGTLDDDCCNLRSNVGYHDSLEKIAVFHPAEALIVSHDAQALDPVATAGNPSLDVSFTNRFQNYPIHTPDKFIQPDANQSPLILAITAATAGCDPHSNFC